MVLKAPYLSKLGVAKLASISYDLLMPLNMPFQVKFRSKRFFAVFTRV